MRAESLMRAIAAACLLASCQGAPTENQTAGSIAFRGQVFVTIREGSSVKLGGVEVRAHSAEDTVGAVEVAKASYEERRTATNERLSAQAKADDAAKLAAAQKRAARIQTELTRVSREIEQLEGALKRASSGGAAENEDFGAAPTAATLYFGQKAVAVYVGDDVASSLIPLLGKAHSTTRTSAGRDREMWAYSDIVIVAEAGKIVSISEEPAKLASRIGERLATLRREQASLQAALSKSHDSKGEGLPIYAPDPGLSAAMVFRHLPRAIATAVTDADGRFSIEVPTPSRFALSAHATRELINGSEELYWLVWVDPAAVLKELYLTNRNLLTTGGGESVMLVTRSTDEE